MYVAEVYANLQRYSMWPDGESWSEQDNLLYSAVMLFDSEVARIQEAQREEAGKKR